MRVDTIKFQSYGDLPNRTFATFSLDNTSADDKYILSDVAGLDASSIVPQFYGKYGTLNLFDMRLAPREVVMRIKLNPDYETGERPSDLRDELYKAIALARVGKVSLAFWFENVYVGGLDGFITKFETSIFSMDPEVQITIMCYDPYIYGAYVTRDFIDFHEAYPLTTPTDYLAFYDNVSTAPHGFYGKFEMTQTPFPALFTIDATGLPGNPHELFTVNYAVMVGDILEFSSEYNNRFVNIIRSGVTTSIGDKVAADSLWPVMFPGICDLSLSQPVNVLELKYMPHYWGV